MAPQVRITANQRGATDWEIISLRNDERQLLPQLQGCIWAPVLMCAPPPDPHCHWLVVKTDVTVPRSCLFVSNRHLNTGGGASSGDRNHVTLSGFVWEGRLLQELGFGSGCVGEPAPALNASGNVLGEAR